MASSASFQQIYRQQSPFSVIDFGTRKIEENTIKKRQTLTGPTASGLYGRWRVHRLCQNFLLAERQEGEYREGNGMGEFPLSLSLPNSELLPSFPQTGNRPSMAAAADDAGALPPLSFMSGNVVTANRERATEQGRRSQSSGMKILLQ